MVHETGEATERFLRSVAKGEASADHRRILDRKVPNQQIILYFDVVVFLFACECGLREC